MLTSNHISILKFVATYFCVTRMQINRSLFPDDKSGRSTRKWLKFLADSKLIRKNNMQVVNPSGGAPAPVYSPTQLGIEFLACELKDEQWLHVCTQTPNWQNLHHWTAIAEFHIVLDAAMAKQDEVSVDRFVTEWQIANPEEKAPEKKFTLFTILREQPRLVINPDAGFVLSTRGHKKVFFLEIDRGTSGVKQIAASKTPGFSELAKQKKHFKLFPESNVEDFTVLNVVPTAFRIKILREAFQQKAGANLWKWVSVEDVSPEKLLFEAIIVDLEGNTRPLIKLPTRGNND